MSVPLRTRRPPNVTADSSPKIVPATGRPGGCSDRDPRAPAASARESAARRWGCHRTAARDAPAPEAATSAAAAPAASAAVEPAGASAPRPAPARTPGRRHAPTSAAAQYVQAASAAQAHPVLGLARGRAAALVGVHLPVVAHATAATTLGPARRGRGDLHRQLRLVPPPHGAGSSGGGIGQQLSDGEVAVDVPGHGDQISFVTTAPTRTSGGRTATPTARAAPRDRQGRHAAVGGHPHRRGDRARSSATSGSCFRVRNPVPARLHDRGCREAGADAKPAAADGDEVRPPRGRSSSAVVPPGRPPRTGWPSAGHDVARRGEEDLPPGEDLWRRADAAGSAPAARDGSRPNGSRTSTASTACAPSPMASRSS